LTFSSCDNKKIKRVIVDDVIAEGEISNDTVFNGTIKFYDTGTGKLVETANYKAGILDGERTTYYDNGKQNFGCVMIMARLTAK
jgi:antitoxin component YwqK of YwqJK toxin-antitoxin module